MKTTLAFIIVLLLVGGGYYYVNKHPRNAMMQGPSGAAGINGSPNQGNLGRPVEGEVQLPGADGAEGMIIGSNLALGTDAGANGPILIGFNGLPVYTFDKDTVASSTCYATCALNWPPYLVGAEDNVSNVKSGVVGKTDTIIRADGSIQLTYNGKPLYFYGKDMPGKAPTGDGVNGVWKIATP